MVSLALNPAMLPLITSVIGGHQADRAHQQIRSPSPARHSGRSGHKTLDLAGLASDSHSAGCLFGNVRDTNGCVRRLAEFLWLRHLFGAIK